MKKVNILLIVLLSLGAVQTMQAQSPAARPGGAPQGAAAAQGQVTGTVVDADADEPIATATVALWRAADSTLATGAITQEDGRFVLDGLRGGSYYARISFVGFETQTISGITLDGTAQPVDLGIIRLGSDTQQLGEVEITAAREFMEVGIDRTVYNTRDQLVSLGGNAVDVLQNIPSVEVDIDGNVSLRGNQNVAILLNGKPAPMTGDALTSFLQGLPADAVERIEVIPNPSAKYEPDGMAGILNIVLKQDRDLGLSGSVSASASSNDNYNASTNLNYGKGRINLSASYGLRFGTRDGEGWLYRENRFLDPLTVLDQNSYDERGMLSHNLNTSLDYRLNRYNTLSLSALLNQRGGDTEGLIAYNERDAAGLFLGRSNRLTEGDGSNLNTDYRLSFRRVLDPSKHELITELRYQSSWGDDFDRFTETAFTTMDETGGTIVERQTNEQDSRNEGVSMQVDYTRPLGEGTKLEAGYKGEWQQMNNDFYSETFDAETGAFTADVNLNNAFAYDQQIHAAYGIVGTELGRFGMQGGVRLEQALTNFTLEATDDAFENNYFSIFPSAFLTFKASETQTFKLSYSKRINRPRTGGFFNQLNPFSANADPYFRRVGNPYLKPEYVHAFEAGFTQFTKAATLTVSPYFRRTVDVIRFIETIDNAGVTTLTFQNLDTSDSWGTEFIGTLQLGRWLNAYASFNLYKVVTDGSNVDSDLSNNAIGYASRANATVNVRPGLDLQLSYFYSSPLDIENGRIAARQMTDIALRQKLLGDKASLSLRASDVFGTMGFHLWREDARFSQEVDRSFNAQQIGLSFSYNFGQPARNNRRDRREQGEGPMPDDPQMQMQ